MALFELGRRGEALAEFEAAAEIDGDDAMAHLGRFHALSALGRAGEAGEAYEMAVALEPRLRAQGRPARARPRIAEAVGTAMRAGIAPMAILPARVPG